MKFLRLIFELRLPTVFLLVGMASALIGLNLRAGDARPLGHVSSDKPPIRPGLWIVGNDYGWPWTYRTEAFKTDIIAIDAFDRFDGLCLAGNMAVAIASLVALWTVMQWMQEKLLRRWGERDIPLKGAC